MRPDIYRVFNSSYDGACIFNYEVPIDILEEKDYVGERFSLLSMVCNGTTSRMVALVRVGGSQSSSHRRLSQFSVYWHNWAGWPSILTSDRGLHSRGVFSTTSQANGVLIRTAGLEAPSQLGRGERHGGIYKNHLKHMVKVHRVIGKKGMKMAASAAIERKNRMMRNGGIAPCQWVLGKCSRGVGHLLEEEVWG